MEQEKGGGELLVYIPFLIHLSISDDNDDFLSARLPARSTSNREKGGYPLLSNVHIFGSGAKWKKERDDGMECLHGR